MQRLELESQDGRVLLQHYTAAELQDLFPADSGHPPNMKDIATVSMLEELQNKILAFTPANDTQRWLQARETPLDSFGNGDSAPLPHRRSLRICPPRAMATRVTSVVTTAMNRFCRPPIQRHFIP
jgi:hypothetical protein